MASAHTTNLGLNKPDRQDFVSVVNDINDNMDMIDTAIGNLDTDKVNVSDIVDNLTTNDHSKPLSASQGYALNSKTSAIQITNNYSTILDAINAYRNVMNYPFTIQKTGNSAYTDIPSGVSQTCEWNLVCIGDKHRTTAVLTIYTGDSSANGWSYTANIYEGSYIYNWSSVNSKINISQYAPLTIASGVTGTIYIGRLGKQRVLTGYFKPNNAGTNILVATLDSADRPPVSIYFSCTGYTVAGQCECSISTAGEIRANVPTGANNNTVKFNASWFIN